MKETYYIIEGYNALQSEWVQYAYKLYTSSRSAKAAMTLLLKNRMSRYYPKLRVRPIEIDDPNAINLNTIIAEKSNK